MIEVTENQIERVNAILGEIKGAPNRVFSRAINRGLSTIKTQANRLIRDSYHIKRGNVANNLKLRKATTGNLAGEIEFAGYMIPLIQFKVSHSAPAKKPVSAAVLKENSGTRLQSAYIANLGFGMGVFERETSKRDSSKQLFGPSVAHMAHNENVVLEVDELARETIEKRVEHEISRILEGL